MVRVPKALESTTSLTDVHVVPHIVSRIGNEKEWKRPIRRDSPNAFHVLSFDFSASDMYIYRTCCECFSDYCVAYYSLMSHRSLPGLRTGYMIARIRKSTTRTSMRGEQAAQSHELLLPLGLRADTVIMVSTMKKPAVHLPMSLLAGNPLREC